MPGSAHGARKIAATRVANAGATVAQLEAIFGWRGGKATRHVATDLCAALRSAGPYRAQTGAHAASVEPPLMPQERRRLIWSGFEVNTRVRLRAIDAPNFMPVAPAII